MKKTKVYNHVWRHTAHEVKKCNMFQNVPSITCANGDWWILFCKADDGLEVPAHKIVLMAASEYFRTMFKSCFNEAGLSSLDLHGTYVNCKS